MIHSMNKGQLAGLNNFWTVAGHEEQAIKILSDQVLFLTSQNQYWIKAN